MCIFSGAGVRVKGTHIFARVHGDRQYLAYQMDFEADADVAMVLPLPVVPASGDDAVAFIDLSGYASFFQELQALFPSDLSVELAAPRSRSRGLEVHAVGEFVASYVPSIADFARLDRRFRLSPEVWGALPQYRDFGFAVFELSKRGFFDRMREPKGARKVHPMAFSFPTRSLDKTYFPTVHVHDGAVHPRAEFDHELYCQRAAPPDWDESVYPVGQVAVGLSRGVLCDAHVLRRSMHGTFDNADVYV